MADPLNRPARKSPRLTGYNYAQDGAYFVTLCAQNRVRLFGQVIDQAMQLNAAGEMITDWWQRIPDKFTDVELDLFVVMPNHMHGIPLFNGRAGTQARPYSVSTVVAWFKTMSTNHYIQGVKQQGWEPFPRKLWQRSFHDRIIRSERECNTLREYTLTNAMRWEADTFYIMEYGEG